MSYLLLNLRKLRIWWVITSVIRVCYVARSGLRKGDCPGAPDQVTCTPKGRELSPSGGRRGLHRNSKHEKDTVPHRWLWEEGGQRRRNAGPSLGKQSSRLLTASKEMATSVLQPWNWDLPTRMSLEVDSFLEAPQYSPGRPTPWFQPWEPLSREPSCVHMFADLHNCEISVSCLKLWRLWQFVTQQQKI